MNKKQKKWLKRILIALAVFFAVMALEELGVLAAIFGEPGALYASFALYLIPYLIAGHDVLLKAWRNIRRGEAFDESFLMAVATIGAFAWSRSPVPSPIWQRAPPLCSFTRWASCSKATPWARAVNPSPR